MYIYIYIYIKSTCIVVCLYCWRIRTSNVQLSDFITFFFSNCADLNAWQLVWSWFRQLGQAGQWQMALWLYATLWERQLQADLITYSTLETEKRWISGGCWWIVANYLISLYLSKNIRWLTSCRDVWIIFLDHPNQFCFFQNEPAAKKVSSILDCSLQESGPEVIEIDCHSHCLSTVIPFQ